MRLTRARDISTMMYLVEPDLLLFMFILGTALWMASTLGEQPLYSLRSLLSTPVSTCASNIIATQVAGGVVLHASLALQLSLRPGLVLAFWSMATSFVAAWMTSLLPEPHR